MGPMDQSTGFVLVQHWSGWIVWSLIPWFRTLVHFYVDSMMQRNGGECNFTVFFQSWRSVYFRHTFVINQAALHFWWFDGNRKTGATRYHKVLSNSKALATFFVNITNFAIVSLTARGPQQPGKCQKSIGPDLAFVWAGSEPSSPTWSHWRRRQRDNSNSGFIDFDRGLIDRRPCPKKQNSYNGFSTTRTYQSYYRHVLKPEHWNKNDPLFLCKYIMYYINLLVAFHNTQSGQTVVLFCACFWSQN